MIVRGNAALHKINHEMLGAYGVLFRNEEEVTCRLALQRWHLTGIDTVGIDNNLTLLRLAKEFR